MWNLVPWDIGLAARIQVTGSNHRVVGTAALLRLLGLLPKLRVVIFFGLKAQVAMAEVALQQSALTLLRSPHPSPSNLNSRPRSRGEILAALAEANRAINDG